MERKKPRVAITHGDTNGIGYELIFKTFTEPEMLDICTPVIYGSPKVATYHRKALNIDANFNTIGSAEEAQDGKINILTVFDEDVKVDFGTSTPESMGATVKAVRRAVADINGDAYDAIVLAPIAKNDQITTIKDSINGEFDTMTLLVSDFMRMGFVTEYSSLKDVSTMITQEIIVQKATNLANTLKRDFRISLPRIAVFALNQDAEMSGKEEQQAIIPAIEELAKSGINAFGPFLVDDFFNNRLYESFDGVLAMYYEQGSKPFTSLYPNGSVEFTTGLPKVVTSQYEHVDFNIAGKGIADETAFRNAIYLAIDTFRNRINYDKPYANPLKKLYSERRDDSEKIRFSVARKRETNAE